MLPIRLHWTACTLGKFKLLVKFSGEETEAEFMVINGRGRSLLGRKTSLELGVLKLGPQVNSFDSSLKAKLQECLGGIWRLKDYKCSSSAPKRKACPLQLILMEKLENTLKELQEADIVEKGEGLTPWVSQFCVVPKPSGEIRLCVDMRRENKAIIR